MISSYIVQFKTGYELKDGELARLRERIAEELACLAAEHMADVSVVQSHFIPGPLSTMTVTDDSVALGEIRHAAEGLP